MLNYSIQFYKIINSLQSTQASIADAAEEWMGLQLLPEGFDECIPYVRKRQKNALNIFSLAANSLHPVYRGRMLSEDQIRDVDEFLIENLDAEGLDSPQDFKRNRNIFQKLGDKKLQFELCRN